MICEAVDTFPQLSIAVQVLVTLYDPVQIPGVVTSLLLNEKSLPQTSVAVAVAKRGVEGQFIVVSAGNVAKTGAVTS